MSKTSAGALEMIDINCTEDPPSFLKGNKCILKCIIYYMYYSIGCKSRGWKVLGCMMDKKAENNIEISNLELTPEVYIMWEAE